MPTQRRTPAKKVDTATKQEVICDLELITKGGVYRFKEDHPDGERQMMGTIYLRKDVAEKLKVTGEDAALKVTLEAYNE